MTFLKKKKKDDISENSCTSKKIRNDRRKEKGQNGYMGFMVAVLTRDELEIRRPLS